MRFHINILFAISISIMFSEQCYSQQDTTEIMKVLRDLAANEGVGSILFVLGEEKLVFPLFNDQRIFAIDLEDQTLDSNSILKIFRDPKLRPLWEKVAGELILKGFEARAKNDFVQALKWYRLPFYFACLHSDWENINAITSNIWIIKEHIEIELIGTTDHPILADESFPDGIKPTFFTDSRYVDPKTNTIRSRVVGGMVVYMAELLEDSVRNILNYHLEVLSNDSKFLIQFLEQPNLSTKNKEALAKQLIIARRVTSFSGDREKSQNYLLKMLELKDSVQKELRNEIFLSLLEGIANIGRPKMLSCTIGLGAPEDPMQIQNFCTLWNTYLNNRKRIKDEGSLTYVYQRLYILYRILSELRSDAVRAGAAFGHGISYEVARFLQPLGRDIAYSLARIGASQQAFMIAEDLRSRALGDWIARSHRTERLVINPYKSGSVGEIMAAEIDEAVHLSYDLKTPILSYLAVENGFLCWLITPDGYFRSHFIEDIASELNNIFRILPYHLNYSEAVRSFKGSKIEIPYATKEIAVKAELKKLYNYVIPDKFAKILEDSIYDKLIIIPDDNLKILPFCALVNSNNKFLLEQYQISYWPSVSSWSVLNSSLWPRKKKNVTSAEMFSNIEALVIGDPNFTKPLITGFDNDDRKLEFDPLPGTKIEAEAIAEIFGIKPMLQDSASKAIFSRRVDSQIIHLASHGFIDWENGFNSFIALSDGILSARYFYENPTILKTNFIMLSACQTALGERHPDSEIGLTNALLVGGANSVGSTLWKIPDESTSYLMIEFYKELAKGKGISESLRIAQLKVLNNNETSHPFYWAGFKITGLQVNPLY